MLLYLLTNNKLPFLKKNNEYLLINTYDIKYKTSAFLSSDIDNTETLRKLKRDWKKTGGLKFKDA